MITVLSI